MGVGRAVSGALVAAVLAGCGGSAVELDPVAEAATRTLDAGSSRFVFVMAVQPRKPPAFEIRGEGAFDYEGDRGRVVYDMSDVPGIAPDARMEVRVLGPRIYFAPPRGFESEFGLPPGKRWVSVDTSGLRDGRGFGIVTPVDQTDPGTLLRYFRAASTRVEELGARRLRGVKTRRYATRLELNRLIDVALDDFGATQAERDAARAEIEGLERMFGSSIPATIDVDADRRLRRLSMDVRFDEGGLRMTYEFFDFGIDVAVAAPPRGIVFDLPAAGE